MPSMPGGQLCLHKFNFTTLNIRAVSAWERCIWITEPQRQRDLMPILVVSQSMGFAMQSLPKQGVSLGHSGKIKSRGRRKHPI